MADTATNPSTTSTQTSTTPVNTGDMVARDLAKAALQAALVPPVVSIDSSATYNTSTTQSQVGLGFSSTQSTFNTNLGEKVVDTSLLTTIQSRNVYFSAYHLKPLTRLYAFFDNINVTEYVDCAYRIVLDKVVHSDRTKKFSRTNSNVEVLFAKGTTIYINQTPIVSTNANGYLEATNTFSWDGITYTVVSVSKSNTLTTDENGYIAGTFMIPAKKFNTGTRPFLLCDSSTNNGVEITTSAEFMYYASGMSVSKQSQTLSTRINQVTINPMLKSSTTEVAGTSVAPQAVSAVNPVVITVDQTAPYITNFSPSFGATGVSVSSNIIFTFDDAVIANTGTVTLSKANGTVIPSTAVLSGGNTLTITPTSTLDKSTVYKVTIPNDYVRDSTGNKFAGLFDYQITTELPVIVPTPIYKSTVINTTVYEGSQISVLFKATNVAIGTKLYYSVVPVSSTLNSSDFTTTANAYSGFFVIDSTFENWVRIDTAINDGTESPEKFNIALYETLGGTAAHSTETITLLDIPSIPYVTSSFTLYSLTEGESTTCSIKSNLLSTALYWQVVDVGNGGSNVNDFLSGSISGTVTTDSLGNIDLPVFTLNNDTSTEGNEKWAINIYTGSLSGTLVHTTPSINVQDYVAPVAPVVIPTYVSSVFSNYVITEGQSTTCTLTSNLLSTTLYWQVIDTSNGGINAADFLSGSLSGNVTTDSTGTITLPIFNMNTGTPLEGTEKWAINIYTGSLSGTLKHTTESITVYDGVTPVPDVVASSFTNSILTEGQSTTCSLTSNLLSTTLYWQVIDTSNGGINATDFLSGSLSGNVTTDSTGKVDLPLFTMNTDSTVEGTENWAINIYTGSLSGTLKHTTGSITVYDYVAPVQPEPPKPIEPVKLLPEYIITASSTIVEGNFIDININTKNVNIGTILFWRMDGIGSLPTSAADFVEPIGEIEIVGDVTTFSIKTNKDAITETNETCQFKLYSAVTKLDAELIGTSNNITIVDSPIPTYRIEANKPEFTEGDIITFTVTTTNVSDTTPLYYNLTGIGIDSVDFVGGKSGTIPNRTSGVCTFTKQVAINAD